MSDEKKAEPKRVKPPSGKGPTRQSAGRLNYMIRDLKKLKAELVPEEGDNIETLEVTGDDYQKVKTILNKKLSEITSSVKRLNEIRKERNGVRDPETIGMQVDNNKMIVSAQKLWDKLREAFQKSAKKGKLDPKILEERRRYVEIFGGELMKLQEANSGIKRSSQEDQSNKAITENRARAAARAQRRQEMRAKRQQVRRANRGSNASGAGSPDDIEMDDMEKQPVSKQEQEFYMEVERNNKEMDDLLDVISAGLRDLHNMATDIGTSLDTQAKILEEVDEKMEGTLENYETANSRLRKLLEESTGGVETWCPIIILVVVLIAVIGYLVSNIK